MNMGNDEEKWDALLIEAFQLIPNETVPLSWAITSTPYQILLNDCKRLSQDKDFVKELKQYLNKWQGLHPSMQTFFTYVLPAENQRRGYSIDERRWWLSRWLPTFLVLNAPIGRFLGIKDKHVSPLNSRLGSGYSGLTAAKDFLKSKSFTNFRNGLAHWHFEWLANSAEINIYDEYTGSLIETLHYKQAEAFHLVAIVIIKVIYEQLIRQQ